jgi:YD repeat-containing protein
VATWRDEEGGKGERFAYNETNQVTNVSSQADNVWTENPINALETEVFNYAPGRLNRDSPTRNGVMTNYRVAAPLNQYTSVGSSGRDANFNLTDFGTFHGIYDPENHLVGGNMRATYDGLGRSVRRTTPSGRLLFTYDGWKPILEWGPAGNWTATNVYGAGADEILARQDSSATVIAAGRKRRIGRDHRSRLQQDRHARNARARRAEAEQRKADAKVKRDQEKKVRDLEMQILKLEGRQKELTEELEKPETYERGGAATQLNRELHVITQDLERLTATWESLGAHVSWSKADQPRSFLATPRMFRMARPN